MSQRFTVPQFISNETAIIGKVTIRQFLISLVGAIFIFICYKIFMFTTFIISGLLILVMTFVVAFAKINGRPFHFFVLNFLQTIKKPNLRVWNHKNKTKDYKKIEADKVVTDNYVPKYKAPLALSSLNKLSLIVDTSGVYKGDVFKPVDNKK